MTNQSQMSHKCLRDMPFCLKCLSRMKKNVFDEIIMKNEPFLNMTSAITLGDISVDISLK